MGNIIVSGEKFEVNANVVLWNDSNGLSFYGAPNSFGARSDSLNQLQEKIDSVILHHSVTYRAINTYNVLIQRNLSVNFIVDDNNIDGVATIYQCLDVKDAGYSQKPYNYRGPGVEICYLPLVKDNPSAYSEVNIAKYKVQPHKIADDIVNGVMRKVYCPTEAQVKAVEAICKGLQKAFPKLEMKFPRKPDGSLARGKMIDPKGLMLHYHCSPDGKIDAAGFPMEELENALECPGNFYDNL